MKATSIFLAKFNLLWLILPPMTVLGHSGGLDARGGHYDRRTGEYHCHSDLCRANEQEEIQADGPYVTLYDRNQWRHWIDEDSDCQDTRAEVLIRDSSSSLVFRDNNQCVVASGLWIDVYSDLGYTNALEIDIDHIVPLAWAHGHGGANWSQQAREDFANDFDNLMSVHSSINSEKGSKGPDDWTPNNSFRCEYIQTFISIMEKYQLEFVEIERKEIEQENQHCALKLID